MVKPKVRISRNFKRRSSRGFGWLLPGISIATFLASWLGVFPPILIERWYARRIFPVISEAAEKLADVIAFSWLDLAVPICIVLAAWLIHRRRWKLLLNLIAALYLIFFWLGGLN